MADTLKFLVFSNLPPELRLKIWGHALPGKITNLLYIYKRGCWSAQPILESDERYDNQREIANWSYIFCPKLLTEPSLKVSLGFVNREARGVALSWVHAQSSELKFPNNTVSPVFRRLFDVSCDTLYVSPDRWNDFLHEPVDQSPTGREMEIHGQIKQLAISESLIRSGLSAPLRGLMEYFYSLRILYIILNGKEGAVDDNIQASMPYRYQEIPGGYRFLWNPDLGAFGFEDGDDNNDETLSQLIKDSILDLQEGLIYMEVPSFEVRLATKHLYTSYL